MKQENSDEFVLSEINKLKTLGYDQIRTPGGSELKEVHYSGVFLYTYNIEKKQFFFLGVPYDSDFYLNHKSNGHTKKEDESPTQTARREVYEETGLLVDEGDLDLILSYSVKHRTDETKLHQKFFYMTSKFNGTLSNFLDQPNPIDNETSTPIWMSAKLFKKVLYYGHQQAFKRAVEMLRLVNAEYYYALSNI